MIERRETAVVGNWITAHCAAS